MFDIDNNFTIKISKGDTAYFPLFLNKGTPVNWIRYGFKPNKVDVVKKIGNFMVTTDGQYWKEQNDGDYNFIYSDGNWTLNGSIILPENYGFSIDGLCENQNYFILHNQTASKDRVYFYLFKINAKEPFLEKEFNANDDIYYKQDGTTDGDMKITISPDMPLIKETEHFKTLGDIPEGHYKYQIKLYISNSGDWNTVTNKNDFYYIDDQFQRVL